MKKLVLAFAFVGALSLSIAGNGEGNNPVKTESIEYKGGKLTIKNDSGDKIRIHTGYGETTMTKGASTSVTCSPGKTVKHDGKVLFKVTADMCGTTVNLSDYL